MLVAIVSSLEYCDKISEDLSLREALTNNGVNCEIVAWDDPDVDWKKYDVAVLRSAWGYHKKYNQFLVWLDYLDVIGLKLINDTNIVRWNIRKDLQLNTLEKLQIPVVPYQVLQSNVIDIQTIKKEFQADKIVIKPVVSASGYNTFFLENKDEQKTIKKNELPKVFNDSFVIVQPYVKQIESGEYALVFIGGKFSHAVIRYPGVLSAKQKTVYIKPSDIPVKIMQLAIMCSKKLANLFGMIPSYARYDIVNDMIMEVELAEPDLMTRDIPEQDKQVALNQLARQVVKKVML